MPKWLSHRSIISILAGIAAIVVLARGTARGANASVTESAGAPSSSASATAPAPPAAPLSPSAGTSYGNETNEAKARALVMAAINMKDSDRAVKLLWQATEIDPTLAEAYIYLGLFYNSRSNFGKVVEVYQKLVKFEPKEVSAYLNIGEAYMSFAPPRMEEALPYYRRALELDPASPFAALRLGEIYAQQGNREQAVKFLRLASGARAKNPDVAEQADKFLREMGS